MYPAKQSTYTQGGCCHFIKITDGAVCERFALAPYGPRERGWSQWVKTQAHFSPKHLFPTGHPKMKLAASAGGEFSVSLGVQALSKWPLGGSVGEGSQSLDGQLNQYSCFTVNQKKKNKNGDSKSKEP